MWLNKVQNTMLLLSRFSQRSEGFAWNKFSAYEGKVLLIYIIGGRIWPKKPDVSPILWHAHYSSRTLYLSAGYPCSFEAWTSTCKHKLPDLIRPSAGRRVTRGLADHRTGIVFPVASGWFYKHRQGSVKAHLRPGTNTNAGQMDGWDKST